MEILFLIDVIGPDEPLQVLVERLVKDVPKEDVQLGNGKSRLSSHDGITMN